MAKIDHDTRLKVEKLIYDTFDAADKSGANTEYYRKILAPMTDDQFYKFMSKRLPFRFQLSTFKNEPQMSDIVQAFRVIDKPLLERVKLPYLYSNSDGEPIESEECMVIYLNVPRMKQMLIKKNNTAIDISNRDKTGSLIGGDKGGRMSDREFQSLAASGLYHTMDEFSGFRADAMKAKQIGYNTIMQKGFVSEEDIPKDKADGLAKNMMNAWLIGCNIMTNLVCVDYATPRTLAERKQKGIERV